MEFSEIEKKWICGDPTIRAWKAIPLWQTRFFLRTFLQKRAYHQPVFKTEYRKLIVGAGPKTLLEEWSFLNAPSSFNYKKRRRLKQRPLTPALLDEIENWSKSKLQSLGYACPEVSVLAFPEKGSVTVSLIPGKVYEFPKKSTLSVRGENKDIYLDRYRSFLPGQKYDFRLLQLTANRMMSDEYFLSSYFDTQCTQDGITIVPRLVSGDPQLISAGAGFNTEVGAIGIVRYRHTQLNDSGSSFESKLSVSFKEQIFENSFTLYDGPPYRDRSFLAPQLNFRSETENIYQSTTFDLGFRWGSTTEFESLSTRYQLGPFYTYNYVESSTDIRVLKTVSSSAEISVQSHNYEYYAGEPRSGFLSSFSLRSAYKGLGAEQTFHQLHIQHQSLWNWMDWEPPLAIIGWRIRAGSFLMADDSAFFDTVPENLRFYLGGDTSLRGFARKQIPFSEKGSATYLYQGFEIRAGEVFPHKLQPFIFLDFAWEGERSFNLSRSLYYSPGFGIRWSSFLGPVRASLSQGRILWSEDLDSFSHWQAYLSLGREF